MFCCCEDCCWPAWRHTMCKTKRWFMPLFCSNNLETLVMKSKRVRQLELCEFLLHSSPCTSGSWSSRKQGLCHLPQLCSAPGSHPLRHGDPQCSKVEASCSQKRRTSKNHLKNLEKESCWRIGNLLSFRKMPSFHRGISDLSPLLGWIALVTKTVEKEWKRNSSIEFSVTQTIANVGSFAQGHQPRTDKIVQHPGFCQGNLPHLLKPRYRLDTEIMKIVLR